MRITQWGEYGLLLSLYIAQRELDGETTVGAAKIAQDHDIALQYAQQILHRLKLGGVLSSVRGPHGGYRLSRAASEITLRDVLLSVEGDTFELICETKPIDPTGRCAPTHPCLLRPVWIELRTYINDFLTGRTLEHILQAVHASDQPVQISR